MLRVLGDEALKRRVRFREFLFVSLSFSEQKISVGSCSRVWVIGDYLLVRLRALRAG